MAIKTMSFPVAKRYAKAGYAVRRAVWNGSEGGHELAWVTYRFGLYFYTTASAHRVVKCNDVTADDLRAMDWTLQGVDGADVSAPPVNELPGEGGTGGSGGITSGGGGGGSPSPYPGTESPLPGDFNNPNGGSQGSGEGTEIEPEPRRKKKAPTETEMTLTVTRTTDACIPLVGGLPSQADVEDSFDWALNLSATTDAPAGLWFYSVKYATPSGTETAETGTISPGDSQDGTFTITSPRNQGPYRVWAVAYRPGTGFSASANAKATMRNENCAAPGYLYDGSSGSLEAGTNDINTFLGYLYDGPGPFPWGSLDGTNFESPEDGIAALAATLGIVSDDITISPGVVPGTYEVQVVGAPDLDDLPWALYSDGNPVDGGTLVDSGIMFAVDWETP